MAVYRCAACGSPNVATDTQKEGYNYVKGAIGTAILGAGGAVAGINGNSKRVYKCPDCGLTMNNPMPDEIKNLIDVGVMDVDARKHLILRSVPIEWDFLISKYKNIESGAGDKIAASREAHWEEMRNTKYSLAWQLNYNYTGDEGKALLASLKSSIDIEVAAEEAAEQAQIVKKQQVKVMELQKQKNKFEVEKEQLNKTIATLGFFKFTEKKQAAARLETIIEEIAKIDEGIAKASNSVSLSTAEKRRMNIQIMASIIMKYVGFAMTAEQVYDALVFLGCPYITPGVSAFVQSVQAAMRMASEGDDKKRFNREIYENKIIYYTLAN